MTFTALKSHTKPARSERLGGSAELGWRDLFAERWRYEPGDNEPSSATPSRIMVQMSGRARVLRRHDGMAEASEGSEGMIWLSPGGPADGTLQISGGSVEFLHLDLPNRKFSQLCVDELDIEAAQVELRSESGFRDPVIESIARSVTRELEDPDPVGKLYIEAAAATLDAYLIRRFSNRRGRKAAAPTARGALSGPRLSRTVALIEEKLGEDLSLRELAAEASLSLFHFARAFKAATGAAPHQFVLERRVARARQLLSGGDTPIAEIACVCGFASQAHLTNVFKRATGATPGAFRTQSRKR